MAEYSLGCDKKGNHLGWANDPFVHLQIKYDDDFILAACNVGRIDGQIHATLDRDIVTCPQCIKSEYYENRNLRVI